MPTCPRCGSDNVSPTDYGETPTGILCHNCGYDSDTDPTEDTIMETVDFAVTPDTCTSCSTGISDGEPAVYITGHGYGSRNYELILCENCATTLSEDIKRTIEDARENTDHAETR